MKGKVSYHKDKNRNSVNQLGTQVGILESEVLTHTGDNEVREAMGLDAASSVSK